MKISAKIHRIIPGAGRLKAVAEIVLDGVFVVHNVRLVDGERGLFAAMPSYVGRDSSYRNHCFPITAAFGEEITGALVAAYRDACEALQ